MDEQWRTEEPEVGQPLRIYGESEFALRIYRGRQNGYFMFEGQDGMAAEEDVPEWIPITTPEEQRLRARVRELEAIKYACFRYFDHCRRVSLSARGVDCDSGEMNVRMSLMKDAEISLGMSESGEVGDAP